MADVAHFCWLRVTDPVDWGGDCHWLCLVLSEDLVLRIFEVVDGVDGGLWRLTKVGGGSSSEKSCQQE